MASIEQTIRDYFAAFEASDSAALTRLFVADAVVAPPARDTIVGRTAIKQTFDRLFDGFTATFPELFVDRIRHIGDAAFVETRSTENVTDRATGDTRTGRYRELFCLQHGDDGWRIVSLMFNA